MAHPLFKAAAIGMVAGMRCMSAPAIVAENIGTKGNDNEALGPLALLGDDRVRKVLAIAAGAELIADKLPFIGQRIDAGPLTVRLISGAVCGAAVAGKNKENLLLGALTGSVAAIVAAHIFYSARKRLNQELAVGDTFLAVAEDTVAWTAGKLAVH
jgi:uncharacterized membrane protein